MENENLNQIENEAAEAASENNTVSEEKRAEICAKCKKTSIGGQALLEGIMMRGPKKTSMAVRDIHGEIVLETTENDASAAPKFWKLPIFRGMYNMVKTFSLGYKCLIRSAELSGLEELEAEEEAEKQRKKAEKKAKKKAKDQGEAPEAAAEAVENIETVEEIKEETAEAIVEETAEVAEEVMEESKEESTEESKEETKEEIKEEIKEETKESKEKKSSDSALIAGAAIIGSVLGVGLAIVLFFWLPSFLFELLFKDTFSSPTYGNQLFRSVFEGILKIAIFVGYMAAVTLMPDIRRTFMYHGAEHKTIFCYEQGLPLTVENVRVQRRFHPRCGTSFLIIMLILGILVGSAIPSFALGSKLLNTLLRTAIRLCLLPLVVGIGYELIKYAGRHDNVVTKIFSAPGLWMQRISTKEPDDSMIECAIAAMNEVIPEDDSDKW